MLKLVRLSEAYREQLGDMMDEWTATGETIVPCAIVKNNYRDFDRYLAQLEVKEAADGLVPDSVFFCLDDDTNRFVGAVNIRHRLNALLLPHVIQFNAADAGAARRYARLAGRCGLAQNPRALAAALNRLRAALKLPDRLSACGVEAGQLRGDMDALAEAALADLCTPTNPRSVSVLDVKAILKELV